MSDVSFTGHHVISNFIGTADATVTTISTFLMPSDSVAVCDVKVVGMQVDASTNSAGYIRQAVVENRGGATALVSTVENALDKEDNAAWDVTMDVSGNNIRVRVTGAAGVNITWFCHMDIYIIN